MSPRLLSADAAVEPLPVPVPAGQEVLAGAPSARAAELAPDGSVGVWEMTAGSVSDVEADEVFVVVAGRGTVAFEDGEVLALAPGAVVRLREGERTTWTVEQTLRKVYWAV